MRILALKLNKIFEPRVAFWFGILAPICILVFIGISIGLSPWFSWIDNALSDLGVSKVAFIFNTGLMLTGMLLSLFAISVAKAERYSRYGFTAAICFMFAGFGVVGVGIFTEASIGLHILFVIICFFSFLLSYLFFGVGLALKRGVTRSKILMVLILLGVLGIVFGFIGSYVSNPLGFVDLYKNPPPQYITSEGTVDYLRIGKYIRELIETRYNIIIPGIALMEILCALPMFPLYVLFGLRLYRKRDTDKLQ